MKETNSLGRLSISHNSDAVKEPKSLGCTFPTLFFLLFISKEIFLLIEAPAFENQEKFRGAGFDYQNLEFPCKCLKLYIRLEGSNGIIQSLLLNKFNLSFSLITWITFLFKNIKIGLFFNEKKMKIQALDSLKFSN